MISCGAQGLLGYDHDMLTRFVMLTCVALFATGVGFAVTTAQQKSAASSMVVYKSPT
jgi:hypothetical protein